MTCTGCQKPMTSSEAAAYKNRCEDCYAKNQNELGRSPSISRQAAFEEMSRIPRKGSTPGRNDH